MWTLVYNLVWGVAWFAFMRQEWEAAVATIRRPVPWTADVWFLWVVLTVPMGMAVMAYAASRPRSTTRTAATAALGIWVPFTVGMTAYGLSEALSARVLVLDAVVNLVGLIAASVAGVWSHQDVERSRQL